MNVQTKVIGYDKNGNDTSTLEERLLRTGHLWAFIDSVKFWANDAVHRLGSVGQPELFFIANDLDYKIFRNWKDVTHYNRVEVLKLVNKILTEAGYATSYKF